MRGALAMSGGAAAAFNTDDRLLGGMVLGTVALGLAKFVGKQVGLEALKVAARELGFGPTKPSAPAGSVEARVRVLEHELARTRLQLDGLSSAIVEMTGRMERFFVRVVTALTVSLSLAALALIVVVVL